MCVSAFAAGMARVLVLPRSGIIVHLPRQDSVAVAGHDLYGPPAWAAPHAAARLMPVPVLVLVLGAQLEALRARLALELIASGAEDEGQRDPGGRDLVGRL